MKISIITVCYNSVNTIRETILSVLGQDYNNIEYIVIDGNSNDGTMLIINEYKKYINCLVSENDLGIYDAINKGIKLSNGDYIVILNSNDIFYSKNTISEIVSFHNCNNCSISIGDVIYKKTLNGKIVRFYSAFFWKPILLYFGFMPPHQSTVIKTSVYKNLGYYSLEYKIASDYEIFVRFFLKNKIDYKYSNCVRTIMSTGGVSSQGLKSYILISQEIIKILKLRFNILIYFRIFPKYLTSSVFKIINKL